MILMNNEAKLAMQRGVNKLSDMVKVTLGPRGLNVAIDIQTGSPIVTNDGVTIAESITLVDHFENMGARILREAASRTNDQGGDGTTTSTVLAQAMVNDGYKHVLSGANPILIRNGMNMALETAIDSIKELSVPVGGDIENVASISAGSEVIGKLIATAIKEVTHEGAVIIEESTSLETVLDVTSGLKINSGYASSYFAVDDDRMEAVLENACVLVLEDKLDTINPILAIIEEVIKRQSKLLILCDNISDEPLASLVMNKLKGAISCVVVKTPTFRNKADFLEDVAMLTGAKLVSRRLGDDTESIDPSFLGSASKITVNDSSTIISGGNCDQSIIDEKVATLRTLIEEGDDITKVPHVAKLSRLIGKVAIIKVGAQTEVAMRELKLRIEDSVNATKAAIEQGIVPGGGSVYIHARKSLKGLKSKTPEEQVGINIIKSALEVPLSQIAENAGYNGAVVVEKVKTLKKGYGFDALECKYRDMMQAGIIDPAKVSIAALTNACSVSSSLLTLGGAITDRKVAK